MDGQGQKGSAMAGGAARGTGVAVKDGENGSEMARREEKVAQLLSGRDQARPAARAKAVDVVPCRIACRSEAVCRG